MAPRDLVARVATDPWIHGWWHRPSVSPTRWAAYADQVAKQRVRGAQFAEVDDALVAWRTDPLERAALGTEVGRVEVVVPPSPALPRLDDLVDDDVPPPRLGDDVVDAMTAVLRRASANALADGVSHLVAEVDARALEQVWALERAAFEFLDGTLIFGRRVTATDAGSPERAAGDATIREARADDADAASAIATMAWDRHHADPLLSAAGVERLHRGWVAGACAGRGVDVAWVAEDAEGMLGFTAGVIEPLTREVLGLPTLTMTLAMTAPRARRRGVGRALAMHAIRWAATEGLAMIEIGTPLRQIAASRTAESAGFRLLSSRLTFRRASDVR